jgi:uncharacterized protein
VPTIHSSRGCPPTDSTCSFSIIAPTPLLLIHGTADQVVSYQHAQILLEKAGEPKELWTVSNGQHTEALGPYRAEFAPKLLAVFKKWVSAK